MLHQPPTFTEIIRKWMSGRQLDKRESAVVDAALAVNRADQFLRCVEGAVS